MNTRQVSWFGQPRGLTILFLTEMWEQFSYYGMRALLVYYMTKQLAVGQGKASFIYGAYTALAFLNHAQELRLETNIHFRYFIE